MRLVKFKALPAIGDGSRPWQREFLSRFLLCVPSIEYTMKVFHVIPPFEPLNNLLQSGREDAGMSGGCEWHPFQISHEEYEELIEEWLTSPDLNVRTLGAEEVFQDWREWLEMLEREHLERPLPPQANVGRGSPRHPG